jgi:hypothetical protein
MNRLTKETTLVWATTPTELREIADFMENRIYVYGQSTCARKIVNYEGKIVLEIIVDQDKFKGKCE